MASDVLIARRAQAFLDSLGPAEGAVWQDILERFMADPFPPDGSSEALPFPYPSGTFGHISGPFWFTFQQLNDEVIWIAYIDFRPPANPYRSFTR